MLSQRVPLLITFSAFVILVSIAARDWRPLVLILPLASLLVLAKTFSPISELNLEVKKELAADGVMTGETVTVRLELTNKGKEKISFLEVYDRLPAELALVKGTNHLFLSLGPEERTTLNYEVMCAHRGKYEIGPVYLKAQDPLGFNFVEDTKPVTSSLHVLPFVERLGSSDFPFRRTGLWPGVIHSSRRGEGTEFYGLREYMINDELRKVDWKATARLGKFMTIENESDRSTDIVIILDARTGSNLGDPSGTLLEYSVRAAGSLASLFLNLGNQVALINYCRDRAWVPGGFGKRHLKNILEMLASAEPGETSVPIGYGLSTVFPSKPQIVLVSALLEPNIVGDVRALAEEGYSIFVVSPSFLETPPDETSEATKIAVRILALERRNLTDELRRYSTVVDWDVSVPLRTVMKEVRRWNMTVRH